ncbi:MAG: hypothetical protein ACYCSW_05385 [bacterium]
MKKFIIFLVLCLTIFTGSKEASAKVNYDVEIHTPSLSNKLVRGQIGYLIYHDKKLINIQRAVNSKNKYIFAISIIERNKADINFVTVSFFVFRNDNATAYWSGYNDIALTTHKLRSILPNRSILSARQQLVYFGLGNAMKSVNKYYHIWK